MFFVLNDSSEPPLITQARQALKTMKRVTWLTKKLWLPRAYKASMVALTAVLLITLNPAATAHAMSAAGSTSETPALADFSFTSYEEITPDDIEGASLEIGFATKPVITATEMGTPEKELIAQQERQRKEAVARALVARQAEAQRIASNRRGRASQARSATTASSASTPVAADLGASDGNTYAKGYCTWWVKSKRPDLPNRLGNAGRWLGNAVGAGLPTGQAPKPGAVVVTGEGPIGHVGYVEAVEGDEIIVSDMNMIGRGKVSKRRMSTNAGVIKGFIY